MPESAFEYLKTHSLLFLATASARGAVHIAPMFYATADKSIYFSAPDGSVTAANLTANSQAAVAVADPPADWGKARGLQIEGTVAKLAGDDEATAGALFQAKFPHLGEDALHTHYWRLDAADVRYIHNDQGGSEHFESLGQTWTREKI